MPPANTAPKANSFLVGLEPSSPGQHVQEQVNPLAKLSDRAASAAVERYIHVPAPMPRKKPLILESRL